MANFFLKIDKPFYFAGDVVTGHLLVNVMQPLQATGISLKFSGYQCVKWNTETQIVRPHHIEGQPPPPDPIAQIPPHLIMNTDNMDISDITSEDMIDLHDRRPQYIRTSHNRVYKMRYHQTKNMFGRVKTMIYQCNGLMPGQYSFPITFKTFENWPATFEYYTGRKKGKICYHLVAAVQPQNPMWQMKCGAEVILRETKVLTTPTKTCNAEVVSCCCVGKGRSAINVHFQKDGYIPGEMVRVIVEIDNSMCEADIEGLNIAINNTVGLRSSDGSTTDSFNIFSRTLPGIRKGEKLVGPQAVTESFQLLSDRRQIKPSCNGKLLSSVYDLTLGLSHDVACQCCAGSPSVSLRVMIFPSPLQFNLPSTFTQSSWQPKVMPSFQFAISNAFDNFKIGQMMGGAIGGTIGGGMKTNYPPPPSLPPQMIGGLANNANKSLNIHVNNNQMGNAIGNMVIQENNLAFESNNSNRQNNFGQNEFEMTQNRLNNGNNSFGNQNEGGFNSNQNKGGFNSNNGNNGNQGFNSNNNGNNGFNSNNNGNNSFNNNSGNQGNQGFNSNNNGNNGFNSNGGNQGFNGNSGFGGNMDSGYPNGGHAQF